MKSSVVVLGILLAVPALADPQASNPTQKQADTATAVPLYQVTLVGRTTKAINYRKRGSTKIDFRGTPLLPRAEGEATIRSREGYVEIDAHFDELESASQFGREYLTYVLWTITPEGRAKNCGELLIDGDGARLTVTTELQAFALIVTAEPYFAVTQPSDVVVLENVLRSDTKGKVEEVEAKFELLKRGQYVLNVDDSTLPRPDTRVPLDLLEARNAVAFARLAGADRYASDTYEKAARLLEVAEEDQRQGRSRKKISMTARQAVQTAEDARLVALQRADEEHLTAERQAAADREAQVRAEAAMEAQRRAAAESERMAEETRRARAEAERAQSDLARSEAERARARAEEAAQEAARLKAEADAAREAAVAEQQAAREEAERARLSAAEAEQKREEADKERTELRESLRQQLNLVLETRDTARGLIVNMSDVVFDSGKATLRPGAREKLAKIAGIVLSHPGLTLQVEGHTDSTGSDTYNQDLSERRASSVRDFLIHEGVPPASITAAGYGESSPVASNDSASGRQMNRRVELVVAGETIESKLK